MRTTILMASLLASIAGCGTASSVPPTGSSAEAADLKLMAGKWGIAKVEILSDRSPSDDETNKVVFVVQGALGSVGVFGEAPRHARIQLDSGKSPKEIEFIQCDKDGKIEEVPAKPSSPGNPVRETKLLGHFLGIYQFDGDKVILAVAAPGQPRPKDFKPVKIENTAKDGQDKGVIVLTFEKLSEEEAAKRNAMQRPQSAPLPIPTKR